MEYKLKPLTLNQRIECNDVTKEFNPSKGTVIVSKSFSNRILWLKYGLDEINGIKINENNFDTEVMKLNDNEIFSISDEIAEVTNFSTKKNS